MNLTTKANYVFEVSSREFAEILRALYKHNPDLHKTLKERKSQAISRLFKMLIETEESENEK